MTATAQVPLAALAALLADGTRARFCLALLNGRAWTAGELARHAGVSASTASEHLSQLVRGGILAEERQGRHRYLRLAGPRVAQLIEDLAAHADFSVPSPPATLRAAASARAMAEARVCYDHLAGRVGVAVSDALTARGLLLQDTGFALSDAGLEWFTTRLGVRLAPAGRRPMARPCLDWTERRHHLAGLAGSVLLATVLERGWVVRIGSSRALRVTEPGARALEELLGTGRWLSAGAAGG
jgi:DNA-binding transcriptional ArsR family regulator